MFGKDKRPVPPGVVYIEAPAINSEFTWLLYAFVLGLLVGAHVHKMIAEG